MLTDAKKLENFRKSLNLSQEEFAKKLNKGTSTIGMVEANKRPLSASLKETIKTIFNYDIDKQIYIIEKEFTTITSNIIPIPFYHIKAAANPKGEVLPDYTEEDALFFDKRWLKNVLGVNPYNCSIIEAKGDSMDSLQDKEEDIKDGDLLLIDNSATNIINGKVYIVDITSSNELLVKKVKIDFNGKVSLISNNPKYPIRELTEADNAIIQGRVVWNGSKGNI